MHEFDIVAQDMAFPEGPVAMNDGSVIVVEVGAGLITRCWKGRKETAAAPGGGPNGAAIGPDGALYVCNNGGMTRQDIPAAERGGRIERIDLATGRTERLYERGDHYFLSAPNDLMFDRTGNIWFTDFGTLEPDGKRFGGLYRAKPDGSEIVRVAADAISYNGVGLSPDETRVYVADTFQARIYEFAARPELQTPRLLATVPGHVALDSLAMSADGNICVATIGQTGAGGAITTVAPDGTIVGTVPTDDQYTTNIAFGGPDLREAYITLSGKGQLVHCRWDEAGLRLPFNA